MDVKNNRGQAIFEFIIFVPLMLFTYAVSLNFFAAINGSINQQKVLRGYFFARLKGNSYTPGKLDLVDMNNNGVSEANVLALGWRDNIFAAETGGNDVPEAACYKVTHLIALPSPDECLDQSDGPGPTNFIRPKTVFGICGASYRKINGSFQLSEISGNNSSCANL